jgi:hypothetical protein
LSIKPPLQPWFPYAPEQSINCCYENVRRTPSAILLKPSHTPTAQKYAAAPHCPWFLTGVTAPSAIQSIYTAVIRSV